VNRLLARSSVDVVVVTERPDWFDAGWNVTQVVGAIDLAPGDPDWLPAWQEADRRVRRALTALLEDGIRAGQPVSGPALASSVWEALPSDGVLVVGASQPIRDLDVVAVRADAPTVYANRGLAGIDGTVSTAWGAALALDRPVHALLGDLTFLHDAGGLLAGRLERRPDLRIIVANDGGGSIFAGLEHGRPEFAGAYERLFGTPQEADLAALAAGYGAAWTRAEDLGAVRALVHEPPRGVEVVEVAVDRRRRRDLEAAMRALARDGVGQWHWPGLLR
jgi:2-succinyl-5-enolpyruvyl-6-hydroxy-3-cyclohexene-1-carboxylate synthase